MWDTIVRESWHVYFQQCLVPDSQQKTVLSGSSGGQDQQDEEPAEGIPGVSEVCQGPLVVLKGTSLHAMTWTNSEDILLGEESQLQEDKYCILSLI